MVRVRLMRVTVGYLKEIAKSARKLDSCNRSEALLLEEVEYRREFGKSTYHALYRFPGSNWTRKIRRPCDVKLAFR